MIAMKINDKVSFSQVLLLEDDYAAEEFSKDFERFWNVSYLANRFIEPMDKNFGIRIVPTVWFLSNKCCERYFLLKDNFHRKCDYITFIPIKRGVKFDEVAEETVDFIKKKLKFEEIIVDYDKGIISMKFRRYGKSGWIVKEVRKGKEVNRPIVD